MPIDLVLSVHCRTALLVNSLPLSLTVILGLPRSPMIRSSSRATGLLYRLTRPSNVATCCRATSRRLKSERAPKSTPRNGHTTWGERPN